MQKSCSYIHLFQLKIKLCYNRQQQPYRSMLNYRRENLVVVNPLLLSKPLATNRALYCSPSFFRKTHLQPIALDPFGGSTNDRVSFLSKDSIFSSMTVTHLSWSSASIASL